MYRAKIEQIHSYQKLQNEREFAFSDALQFQA